VPSIGLSNAKNGNWSLPYVFCSNYGAQLLTCLVLGEASSPQTNVPWAPAHPAGPPPDAGHPPDSVSATCPPLVRHWRQLPESLGVLWVLSCEINTWNKSHLESFYIATPKKMPKTVIPWCCGLYVSHFPKCFVPLFHLSWCLWYIFCSSYLLFSQAMSRGRLGKANAVPGRPRWGEGDSPRWPMDKPCFKVMNFGAIALHGWRFHI
jgi:hypothetical protein